MEISDKGDVVDIFARSEPDDVSKDVERFACYIAHKVREGYTVTDFMAIINADKGETLLKVQMESAHVYAHS